MQTQISIAAKRGHPRTQNTSKLLPAEALPQTPMGSIHRFQGALQLTGKFVNIAVLKLQQ